MQGAQVGAFKMRAVVPWMRLRSLPAWAWIAIVALLVLAFVRWGLVLGAFVCGAVASITLQVVAKRPRRSEALWFAFTGLALAPAALALLILAITPTYFRPLWGSIVGFVVLAVLCWTEFGALGLTEVGVRQMIKGHGAIAALLLVGGFLLAGFTVFGVLVGPPGIILMRPH